MLAGARSWPLTSPVGRAGPEARLRGGHPAAARAGARARRVRARRSARIVVRSGGDEAAPSRACSRRAPPGDRYRLPVATAGGAGATGAIVLGLVPGDRALGAEGYRLVVSADGITVTAAARRALLGDADAAPAVLGDPRRGAREPAVARAARHDPRPAALRVARPDARRRTPLLRRRRGEAARRRDDALQAQPPPSPPDGTRAGARDPLLAAAHDARIPDRGRRRAGRPFHAARLRRDRPVRARALRRGRARDRHAGSRQRRPLVLREADLRRRRAGALHGHRGRVQLALHPEGADVRVRRGRRPRSAALTPGPYIHVGGDEAHSTDPADYTAFVEPRPAHRAPPREADVGGRRSRGPRPPHDARQHWQTTRTRRGRSPGERRG